MQGRSLTACGRIGLRTHFTNSGLPSLFHQVYLHVFLSPQSWKTKLPLHRISPVQGQIKQICGATLLAVHSIKTRPLRREPTFPCSITGAPGAGYWEQGPFPHALREPLCLPALYPLPSVGDSLWLRCELYFRFIGLKHLYHKPVRLSTPFCKFSCGEKFNSQMQQLFAYIFVHFIAPQQSRQHSLFC